MVYGDNPHGAGGYRPARAQRCLLGSMGNAVRCHRASRPAPAASPLTASRLRAAFFCALPLLKLNQILRRD